MGSRTTWLCMIPGHGHGRLVRRTEGVTAPRYEPPPAQPDPIVQAAHRILGKESPLDRQVLRHLAREAARFRDLRPFLDGRSDNVLTVALDRLEDEGLLKRRLDASARPAVPRYVLTAQGRQVVGMMDLLDEAARRFSRTR